MEDDHVNRPDVNVYVTKEVCALRGNNAEKLERAMSDMKKSLDLFKVEVSKSMNEVAVTLERGTNWMAQHDKLHADMALSMRHRWTKTQTVAISMTALISLGALIVAVVVAVTN